MPITPTSATADAEDADSEKNEVDRKRRDRRYRISAMPNLQIPRANKPRVSAPSGTKTVYGEAGTRALKPNLSSHTFEQRTRSTANKRLSAKRKQKPCPPPPTPACDLPLSTLPLDKVARQFDLFWRSYREVNGNDDDNGSPSASDSGNDDDKKAHTVSFDDDWDVVEEEVGTGKSLLRRGAEREGSLAPTMRSSKRPASPYPYFVNGQKDGVSEVR